MSKYSKCIHLLASILLVFAVTLFTFALLDERTEQEAYIGRFDTLEFKENWSIQGEDEYQNICLPMVIPNTKGKTITIENTLPSYVDDGMRLCMKTKLQDIYFYIDGELRGCYAGDQLPYVGEYLPSAYVMVDLTKEDAGKPISIQINVKAQGRLNEVTIGYGNNAWFAILQSNFPVAIAAVILAMLGGMAVLAYFALRKLFSSGKAVLFLGETMIVIGFWIISESNIRQLIFHRPSLSTFFSYLFIELIGGFVAFYFNEVQKHKYNKVYITFAALIFGQATVNMILDFSGVAEFYTTLVFSHIWMVAGIIAILITLVIDVKTNRMKQYSITALGMILFICFCVFEIVEFYCKDFYILGMYLCIGLVVLLAATIIQTIVDELEKIKMTVELEKEKEEAERANRLKSQFLAAVSHEMRTPVNAILGMNEMILRESKEEDIRSYANDVRNSSRALLNIINEILDSSKIESGMMEIVEVDYEMGSFLSDIYHMIGIKCKEKHLDLIFDIDPSIPCEYHGDDKRIRQVLVNLLTNAVKYTDQGSVTLKISCSTEGENAVLHYSVRDTGIGIREEDIGKLSDAFRRVDLSRNRNVEGTGLGLNIVQQLLNLMGSELRIKSEYGKGSEFSFDITQRIVNREPSGDFREKLQQAGMPDDYQSGYFAPEAKILVVDDNQMNRKVFRNLLKQTQMQIYEAESGRECLEKIRQQHFDLIFLDHMMPEMDGIETLHAIRDDKLCEGVPVIMLTANAIVGDRERYIGEGFADFLSKPILPEQLDKVILRHLPERLRTIENTREKLPRTVENIEKQLRQKLPELDFAAGLATSSDDVDFYLELIGDFMNLPIKEELTGYLREGDYRNYCIRIHGFKSSAYSIGAKAIGDLAFQMEKLSRESLPEEIEGLQKCLFEQYDRLCIQYNEVINQSFDR